MLFLLLLVAACSSGQGVDHSSSTGSRSAASAASTAAGPSVRTTVTAGAESTMPVGSIASALGRVERLGLIAPTNSDPFAQAVTTSIIARADTAGVQLTRCDSGNDPNVMLDCARRLATQRVDGWIVVDPGEAGPALCGVGPVAKPLVVVGDTSASCATVLVGVDDEQVGFSAGQALSRLDARGACGRDRILLITDPAGNAGSTARAEGIRAGLAGHCPDQQPVEVAVTAAEHGAASIAAAMSDLPETAKVLIAAVDDGAALATVQAIPTARREAVTLVAIGLDQRARCQIANGPPWVGDIALFPEKYGDVVVPAVLDAIAGKVAAQAIRVPTAFVTRSTLGDFYDTGSCTG